VQSVPDLEVRALGPLQVLRQGELIEPGAWGSARPRELLIFLITHPEGCTKEQVGLAFWPDASAAQVRNSFHVTLHRLRRALAHPEWVITANERYRLDPSLKTQFDVEQFEKEMARGLKTVTAGDALMTGLARYRGDFLEGEAAGDWHLEYRERLQRLYIDGLNLQAGRWLEAGQLSEAVYACRRILARDEIHEEAWRRLMTCYARAGERAQALRAYQHLADLLKREFDAEPDAATRAVLKEIRAIKDPL
jgi:DNA-binding SARP family transcriptional activator